MKRYLLTFATPRYEKSRRINCLLAESFGIDTSFAFTDASFNEHFTDYASQHHDILSQPRGAGYWLWKPFLIHWLLTQLPDDDIVMYSDAGFWFQENPERIFDLAAKEGQVFFPVPGLHNGAWTKRDVFIALGCDTRECWDREQTVASCCMWKNCAQSRDRAAQWMHWCEQAQLVTDLPSVAPNLPQYITHRHDQSILGVLTYAWGIGLHHNPAQQGLEDVARKSTAPYGNIAVSIGAIQDNQEIRAIYERFEPVLKKLGIE